MLPASRAAALGGDAAPVQQRRAAPPGAQQQQQHHRGHPLHEGFHQKQQHHDYHQISQQWQVPHHNSKSRPARRAATPAPATVHSAALAQAQHLLAVLEYEGRKGFVNSVGQSGESFAVWVERALSSLAHCLADAGDAPSAQRCAELAHRLQEYGSAGCVEQRAAMVHQAEAALGAARSALQGVHPSRAGRFSAALPAHSSSSKPPLGQAPAAPPLAGAAPPAPADDDAFAALAHEEETAEAGVPAAEEHPAAAVVPGVQEPPAVEEPAPSGRRVKPETVAFRRSFLQAALAADAAAPARVADLSGGEQRTSEWHAMRSRRLTASAFAKALGFFSGDRTSLWEEKVGLRACFAGNEATRWGTLAEPRALEAYKALTAQRVEGCMFQVKHDDAPHGWLGASPDGLIAGLTIADAPPAGSPMHGAGAGVLEIKCPFNKGRPEEAVPPAHAIWYYMPQVQGLMDIFDREWCNLYVWTPARGSVAFFIRRDRAYWAACFDVLAEFWWEYVVPGRQAHERGGSQEEVQALRPPEQHPAGRGLVEWSKRLAQEAPATVFGPLQR